MGRAATSEAETEDEDSDTAFLATVPRPKSFLTSAFDDSDASRAEFEEDFAFGGEPGGLEMDLNSESFAEELAGAGTEESSSSGRASFLTLIFSSTSSSS